jgi:hypothetical protein
MTQNTHSPAQPSRKLAVAIFACALLSSISGCASAPSTAQPSIRILISFRVPVDGAAPDLLSHLERLTGQSIRYASPVSEKLHAYTLFCPADDPGCAATIRLLRTDPAVQDISSDQIRKPFPEPR